MKALRFSKIFTYLIPKMCLIYLNSFQQSRQHHESSMRHKINNDKLLKEKKNQQLQGARSERELRETLQQIEKAAKDAMIADGSQMFAKPAPPPVSFIDLP